MNIDGSWNIFLALSDIIPRIMSSRKFSEVIKGKIVCRAKVYNVGYR